MLKHSELDASAALDGTKLWKAETSLGKDTTSNRNRRSQHRIDGKVRRGELLSRIAKPMFIPVAQLWLWSTRPFDVDLYW